MSKTQYRIVSTVGCFDILHIGHIRLLKYASNLGDRLIVGINSDDSIKKIKGDLRPFNNEKIRKEFLLSFDFVDKVMVYNESNAINFLKQIKPNIFVKGGDYTLDTINQEEKKYLLSIGTKIKIFPLVIGYSTSKIINYV